MPVAVVISPVSATDVAHAASGDQFKLTATGETPLDAAVTTNEATATVDATQAGALTIAKTVAPADATTAGEIETSTFTVTNTGNVTLSGVGVIDDQPDGTGTTPGTPTCTGLSTPTASCSGTTVNLLVGQVATFTTDYTVTQADMDAGSTISDTSYASGTTPSPSSATITSPNAASSFDISQAGSVHVSTVANPTMVDATTQTVTYTFTVTNSGNVTLHGVGIDDTQTSPNTDTLTTGPTCTGLTTPTATCSGNSTTLAVGQVATFTATLKVNQTDLDTGAITDEATATGETPLDAAVTTNEATATVDATQTGALTIAKTVAPADATTAGEIETSTFTVTNTGNVTLSGVGVIDDQPDGTGTTPGTPTCTGLSTPTASCSGTTVNLLVGQVATFTTDYTVTQADMDAGSTISDTSYASGTTPSPSSATITSPNAASSFDISQAGSVHVSTVANPTMVDATTQTVTYTFTVTNSGNVTLHGVGIDDTQTSPNTDTLTTGPTCTGLTTPTATCSGNSTTLAVGQVATFTATLKVNQTDLDTGAITDEATATGETPLDAAVTTNEATATVDATQTGALTIAKTVAPADATTAGEIETSTFTVTNTGNVTLSGVGVIDDQPDGTGTTPGTPTCTGLSTPTASCSGTTVNLLVGQVATFTTDYTVTQADMDAGSTISDTSYASGTTPSPSSATITSPNAASSFDISQTPFLTITKSGSPTTVSALSQNITYTFAVTNTGNVTLNHVGIDDTQLTPAVQALTSGPYCTTLTSPSASCTETTSTTLLPGQVATFTATLVVTQADLDAGAVTDSAISTGTPPLGPLVSTPIPAFFTVTVIQTPGLTIAKLASPSVVTVAGQVITSTFTVVNSGNVTMTNVGVTDAQVTGTGAAPATPVCVLLTSPSGSCSGTKTTVAPGQVATFSTTYVVTQADMNNGTPIDDSATAQANPPKGEYTTPLPATASTTIGQLPSLLLVKSGTPTLVSRVGQLVTYSFAVTNTGNVTVTNVNVSDTQTGSAGDVLASGPTCPSGASSLAVGATIDCTATAHATQKDLDAGGIFDSAVAGGSAGSANSNTGQVNVTSNTSTFTVRVHQSPTLFILTTAGIGFYTRAGEMVPYSFLVVNEGNVTLSDVAVTTNLTGLSVIRCPKSMLDPAAQMDCTAHYVTTISNLKAGDVELSAISTGVTAEHRNVRSNVSGVVVPAIKKSVEVTG